jgi:FMN phosphatase YigB (HAD superfamily)
MQIQPDEAVFVDDNADNVAAAKAVGMEAVHFIEPDVALAELETILVRRGTRSSTA